MLAAALHSIGIRTLDDMMDLGSIEIAHRLQKEGFHVCLSMLCGIEGAIQGVRWHALPAKTKSRLVEAHRTYIKTAREI
ncbi:TfoX/Sxy family DNA transformation protein [bacterium]|nr:TfoX/Sxy family DNA transformation protein [bacterium]